MAVGPDKDSSCLYQLLSTAELHDIKIGQKPPLPPTIRNYSFPASGDNAATNSDGLNNSNEIIVNEAIVKPESVESAEYIDDLDGQSNCSAGIDDSESPKIESQIEKVFVKEKRKVKRRRWKKEDFLLYVEEKRKVSRRDRKKNDLFKDLVIMDFDRYQYICGVCANDNQVSTVFYKQIFSVAAHLKREHNLCLYICDICGDYFKKEADLSRHMKRYIAENFHSECDICTKIFTRLRLLCSNKEAHNKKKFSTFWPCPNCSEEMRTKSSLERHIYERHTKKEPYICRGCDDTPNKDFIVKYAYEPGELELQLLVLNKNWPDSTNYCKSFIDLHREQLRSECLLDYNDHYYNAKFGGKKTRVNLICNIVWKTISKKVFISETPADIQFTRRDGNRYTCLICRGDNKESRNAEGIFAHLKEKHDVCFDICNVCRKYFRKRTDLISIRANKLFSLSRNDLKCKTCHNTCRRMQLFRIYKHFHCARKDYLFSWTCFPCNEYFVSKSMFKKHKEVCIHLAENKTSVVAALSKIYLK